MEKPLFFAFLLIGFGLLDAISGLPVDFSSVGTVRPEVQWITTYILSATGFFIAIVIIIVGCVCCRNGKGFKEFRNSTGNLSVARPEGFVNPVTNAELTIFPPAGANANQICRFEPLPDIKPQTPNLRPAAFSYREREISSQDWFSEPYDNFPRNQLKYVQEYGRGWFGRVVEGEAQNITPKEKLTKVMVKILHEDATATDQMYFLHEVKFYRDLKHPNILRLLGRCLETEPFLIILECYPNGDLKTFLSQNLASARALAEQGVTLQMCSNITSGLQFMHENKFIHTDLAARNCLVGPDLTVKIGDYGNSIEIFKSDYYCAGSVALPVRWCAPETLKCTDVTIETREVTPPANIWSLAIVFWEICEFCKLPYAELNDDQVIVRVLGEKNYFLEKPQMFCLHKDELYHLMKLCWNPPVQRPTASQIKIILENLISSRKTIQNEVPVDPKRISQDFEQRWQHLKPNNIPKMDNAVDVDHSTNCSIISSKLKHAKVGDSSAIDSPLGIFMSTKNSGQESPRFCLKSEREELDKTRSDVSIEIPNKNNIPEKVEGENKDISKSEEVANCKSRTDMGDISEKVNFEYITETELPGVLNTDGKFKSSQIPDVDSWLKGVEINNEEDENFVRNISEAIRDLDAALALEKTSSSEDNSRKSSHQNSPGKDSDENKEIVIDFKLDGDFSSFMNFTQKSFELSSLQNSEQPQSLNFTDPFLTGKKDEFDDNYGQSSLILPVIEESKNSFGIKNDAFDESLKENDSLLCGQSRNSSDTDDEIWRKRIEKGEISEKVKEKSKSIANLMILTHIDASDESDVDLDKPFDRTCRNSFLRRSGSFAKSSLSSNNFGSENDITHAVLEDDFKESLKKLSNDHKEHGHFDSLGMILPTSARRENVWENLFRFSEPESDALTTVNKTEPSQTDVNKTTENSETKLDKNDSNVFLTEEKDQQNENTDTSNNFLGNVASEKSKNNKLTQKENKDVSSNICPPKDEKLDSLSSSKEEDFLVENYFHCDNSDCKADSSNSSEKNSSHLEEKMIDVLVNSGEKSFIQLETIGGSESINCLPEGGDLKIENVKETKNKDPLTEKFAVEGPKVLKEKDENFVSKTIDDSTGLPEITVAEVQDDHTPYLGEIFEPAVTKSKPFKLETIGGSESNNFLPEGGDLKIENVKETKNKDPPAEKFDVEEPKAPKEKDENFVSKTMELENYKNDDAQQQTPIREDESLNNDCHRSDVRDDSTGLTDITVTEVQNGHTSDSDETFEPFVTKSKPFKVETMGGNESNNYLPEGGDLKIENVKDTKNKDPLTEKFAVEGPKVLKEKDENFVSKTMESENYKNDDAQQQTPIREDESLNDCHRSDVRDDSTGLTDITVAEVQNGHTSDLDEIFEPAVTKTQSFKLETIGGSECNNFLPEGGDLKIENVKETKNKDPPTEKFDVEEPKALKEKDENFVFKTIDDSTGLPEITVTEVQDDHTSDLDEIFEPVVTKPKAFKFVMKDDIPEIKVSAEPMNEIPEIEEEEFEFKQDIKPFKFVLKDDEVTVSNVDFLDKKEVKTSLEDEGESSKESGFISILDGKIDEKNGGKFDDTTVIIGACEDFTLDYFKGLKTTSEDIALESKGVNPQDVNLEKIIEDLRIKEENLDVWDKHLDKAFTQQLNNTDFEDISFRSFSMDSPDVDNKPSQECPEKFDVPEVCPIKTMLDFLKSERIHTDKVEEPIHINRFTNLSGMASEEEYDNFKLRTPDDERSSDSGFRDKGSLSESVEDACEGKYNLEDIEAELEEAYVKGAFGNCEVEKENSNSKNSNNFEYEESKFYEDENKNEEDFSDIDGEIEFWQNKDSSDYYPEISEFNPNCSQGWYLHPPDDNVLPHDRNVNEDIVNALRNELRENLPIPTRSFDEFNDFYEPELDDSKTELNIQYVSHYAIPLSTIIEEQDGVSNKSQKGSKNSLLDGCSKARRNMNHIIEAVKSIDTNTFMQYLDFMIENEGRDFADVVDLDTIEESIVEEKEEEEEEGMASPMLIVKEDIKNVESKNFEEDIKNALGIDYESKSDSIISDGEESNFTVFLEDLESGSTQKFIQNVKSEDDILIVNVDTCEATILESSKPKSHVAFMENQSEREEEVVTDNSENDGLIFTPELSSPDRERSLSETSKTSNGTRTGDALSEITLSSPDLVPDCFSTSIQEPAQNNEADEIINDLKNSGIINEIHTPVKATTNSNNQIVTGVEGDCSVEKLSEEILSESGVPLIKFSEHDFESNEKKKSAGSGDQNSTLTLRDISNFNCIVEDPSNLYEMSTSFMGDDDYDDECNQNSNEIEQKQEIQEGTDKELALEDSYTADWESDSTEAEEEVSSSSGEFIWKDGEKESKVKAIEAADCDVDNSLYEKSQSDQSVGEVNSKDSSKLEEIVLKKENGIEVHEEGGEEREDEEEDDDNESSTGSSASITEFVPSAWNSQATPSRPALKSPDKKADQQNKKTVWFKKQKYHCVYEYPREPSDNEDAESSCLYSPFSCEKNPLETGNKHFTFEVSTVELPNKHFPYGISNVIDYSSYADWDVLDGDDGDLSLTDTDSDNGKNDSKKGKDSDFNFYNLSPFDYDFNNTGMINDESEFFVSSSSRPFQGGSSSQFFPGSNSVTVFKNGNNLQNSKQEENELNEKNEINSKDFVTPDSGVEDSANVSPSDKKMDHDDILLQVENSVVSKDGVLNLFDDLKFNFNPEIVENNMKKTEFENNGIENNDSSVSLTDSPSSPLSPSGLGELRHARDKLKLDLPHNHNAELGAVIHKKSQQKPLKF